jgi:hypothetical protein
MRAGIPRIYAMKNTLAIVSLSVMFGATLFPFSVFAEVTPDGALIPTRTGTAAVLESGPGEGSESAVALEASADTQQPFLTETATSAVAITGDAHIQSVALATSSVTIVYPVKARLFGIFSTTLQARARVETDGSVEINYPWYSFLYSSNQAETLTRLETVGRAASTLNTDHLTTVQQLALLGLMHEALQISLR